MSDMGRSTRSRAGQTPRYGMRNLTIEGALQVARRENEVALAGLVHLERLEAQERARVEAVRAKRMNTAGWCECVKRQSEGTMENALDLSDDDDDLEILSLRRLPAASGENSGGSVFNPSPAKVDGASS